MSAGYFEAQRIGAFYDKFGIRVDGCTPNYKTGGSKCSLLTEEFQFDSRLFLNPNSPDAEKEFAKKMRNDLARNIKVVGYERGMVWKLKYSENAQGYGQEYAVRVDISKDDMLNKRGWWFGGNRDKIWPNMAK